MSRRACVLDIIEIKEILVHNYSYCRNSAMRQYNGMKVCVRVREVLCLFLLSASV